MKKLAVIAAAAMLVFSLAGQAAAFFDDELNLTRVVYHRGGMFEVGTDLGVNALDLVSNPASYQDYVVGGGSAAWALSMFPGATLDNLYVAYFARRLEDPAANSDAFMSGPEGSLESGNRKWTSFSGAANSVRNLYATGEEQTVKFEQTTANSYWGAMNQSGNAIGSMAQFLATGQWFAEANLGALLTDGFVDQYLYFFDTPNAVAQGVQVATLRTMADGSTIINPNPVPIPGSVLLLASGLLGIFGFRRKRA